ncbi:MAG: hypothetical protein V7K67_27045 [Nostoc sp.]|uniref:hypothetical protein n=1 Tax=Nostoc sp. TaxID=1180 RepID=UPI002FFB3170
MRNKATFLNGALGIGHGAWGKVSDCNYFNLSQMLLNNILYFQAQNLDALTVERSLYEKAIAPSGEKGDRNHQKSLQTKITS